MKKYIALAATASLAITALAPAADASTLSDIKGHPYEQAIKSLVSKGVITGYTDGTYKPERALKRWDVIVLIGRYLESQGYKVPSDYKTKMRFSDLTPKSGDMLLKYAALVKDNGIFIGSYGKLLHNELLSHEHAALVLVRTFSQLNDHDYFSDSINTDATNTYLDTQVLDVKSRAAIQLFQQFNIVTGMYFKPTTYTTRGEFAHYLYELMENLTTEALSVKTAQVLDANHVAITLKNGYQTTITLSTALKTNVKTNIHFTVLGKTFTQAVTYTVADSLGVESVKNSNGAQFEIHFNKPVYLNAYYLENDINKIVTLTAKDNQGTPSLIRGELSEDKRTFTVTTNGSYPLNKKYTLTLKSVHSTDGDVLTDKSQTVTFTEDKTGPKLVSTEQISLTKVKLTFSEPVRTTFSINFTTAEGKIVTGITQSTTQNPREVIFDLTAGKVNNETLASKVNVTANLSYIYDYVGNKTDTLSTTISKASVFADGVTPTLKAVEQVGARQFKMTFSEPMRINNLYNISVYNDKMGYFVGNIEQDPNDENSYIFTTDEYLNGKLTLKTRSGYYVFDTSGMGTSIDINYLFKYDATLPTVTYTEVVREDNSEYLYVYFDRNVMLKDNAQASVVGTYSINSQSYTLPLTLSAKVYEATNNKKAIRIMLADLLNGIDRENANFKTNLQLTGVYNDYGIAVTNSMPMQFERTKDYTYNANQLKVASVETSRSSVNVKESNTIIVNFNHVVDEESASKLDNYMLGNYVIESATVNGTNPKQVKLKVKEGTITSHISKYLSVENVRAANSVYPMEDYYEEIYLYENVKPVLTDYAYNTSDGVVISSNVVTGAKQITLTYNEALVTPPSDLFIVTNSAGEVLSSEVALSETDNRKVVITFEKNLPRNTKVSIRLKSSRTLTDLYYNVVDFKTLQLTVPYYIY